MESIGYVATWWLAGAAFGAFCWFISWLGPWF
jgi:hypothetical protein